MYPCRPGFLVGPPRRPLRLAVPNIAGLTLTDCDLSKGNKKVNTSAGRCAYRGISLIGNNSLLGPYSRTMSRAI